MQYSVLDFFAHWGISKYCFVLNQRLLYPWLTSTGTYFTSFSQFYLNIIAIIFVHKILCRNLIFYHDIIHWDDFKETYPSTKFVAVLDLWFFAHFPDIRLLKHYHRNETDYITSVLCKKCIQRNGCEGNVKRFTNIIYVHYEDNSYFHNLDWSCCL